MSKKPFIKKQGGAALIVAILVVGLVSVIATLIAADHQIAVRRANNQLVGAQAFQYLLGVEELAVHVLRKDLLAGLNSGSLVDHSGEAWAQAVMPYEVDGGLLQVTINDLQGRFNLNGLAAGAVNNQPVPNTPMQRYLVRMLMGFDSLDLQPNQAIEIVESLIDWLDEDQDETGFGGAEDRAYGELETPYRSANRSLIASSELLLVKGMTDDIYNALEPHVSAWPATGGSVNINTATGPVLAALNGVAGSTGVGQSLSSSEVESLLESRPQEGFATTEDFTNHAAWGGKPIDGPALGVKSNVFVVYGLVELYGHQHRLTSIVWRGDNVDDIRILARSIGGF